MTRIHFMEHIRDIGGKFHENPFAFGPPEIASIKKALTTNSKEAQKEGVAELRREEELFSSFCSIIFENSRPSLEPLECSSFLEDKEIQQMAKANEPINQKRARDLVDCWLFDEGEIGEIEEETRIAMVRLHSRLLLEVDMVLAPFFPSGVDTLLDWLLSDQQDSLEFFITGTPQAEAFRMFVRENRFELKVSAFLDLGTRGWEESPLQIIEGIGKLLYIDVKRISKVSGRDNKGRNLAVEKKKALIDSYVKQKKLKKSLPDRQKKIFLTNEVIEKHENQISRMSTAEMEYYKSIGDRIVLIKRSHVPRKLYSRIIASLIPPTEKIFETYIN